jgi:pyruvate kinase
MDRIARQAETFRADPEWIKRERKATRRRMRELAGDQRVGRINEEMALTAVQFAEHIPARAVVSFTRSGGTLKRMSRYRPGVPLIGVCKTPQVARALLINYGVHPIVMRRDDDDPSISKLVKASRPFLKKYFELTPGDALVVTCGIDWARGGTNAIRVVVEDVDAFDES